LLLFPCLDRPGARGANARDRRFRVDAKFDQQARRYHARSTDAAATVETYSEIAEISSLTHIRVRAHLDRARNKLSAVNVTHAVAVAFGSVIIPANALSDTPEGLGLVIRADRG